MISIDLIRVDGGTQSRVELSQEVINDYAEAYLAGAQMPPVVVFFDSASFWLADGFHRYHGAKQAGLEHIYEDRRPGSQRDALLFSLSANSQHGLRRSNADKRKAVETLLADHEWSTWSGEAIGKACAVSSMTVRSRPQNLSKYFLPGVTWGKINSGSLTARGTGYGFIFSDTGMKVTTHDIEQVHVINGLLNSSIISHFLSLLSETINYEQGNISRIPIRDFPVGIGQFAERAFELARVDWDSYETSWDFVRHPLLEEKADSLPLAWEMWKDRSQSRVNELAKAERENDRAFLRSYGLCENGVSADTGSDATLHEPDASVVATDFLAYVIGCMMGRYSLDDSGLIYAHSGNVGFDPLRYKRFPADTDGIVPITDELWFEDDATNRVRDFLNAVWGSETLDENMAWLTESLGRRGNETPDETIRRYFSGRFYMDHLRTYKKRPIYWHFSSGKLGAFQALVYLHRYHEGTLARVRAEYVVPLTGKMQSRIEMLEKDRDSAGSTAARSKIAKQIESLKKKHVELLAYDERLRHYADMRIQLDLDDGVKVNYGKFGDLLAEVKAVTGGAGDD